MNVMAVTGCNVKLNLKKDWYKWKCGLYYCCRHWQLVISRKGSFSRDKKTIEIFVADSFCDSCTLFQMTSLWRARILSSVLACSSSGQSTWKEAASKTDHKWMPKLLTPALSICSHFLQQPEQNTGIDYWSHATEKEYLLHISHKRTMSYAGRFKYQIYIYINIT